MPCALEPKMYFFFAIDPSPFPMPFSGCILDIFHTIGSFKNLIFFKTKGLKMKFEFSFSDFIAKW